MDPQLTIDVFIGATALAAKSKLALLDTFGIHADYARCEVRVERGSVRFEPTATGYGTVRFLLHDACEWREHWLVDGPFYAGEYVAFVSGGPRSVAVADPFKYVAYVVENW